MRTKLAFGVGAAAEAGTYIAFDSFNMMFYNNVLGLPGKLCGLAVMLSLVLDAVSDPIIGFVSDRWRSKLGRRHPFMYASPIPLAICFYFIYSPPAGISQLPLFLWFTLFTLLFRQSLSLYHVPHLALGAELSTDYHERSVVMSYNTIFQVVGGASAAYFGWTWFSTIEGGVTSGVGYPAMGATVGVLAALAIFVSAHFTRDQIPRLRQPPVDQKRATLKDLFADTWSCLRNRDYTMLLVGLICLGATIGTRQTLQSYLSLFYWGLPEKSIRAFALASPPAYVIAFFLTTRLHRKFDKRAAIIGGVCLLALAAISPIALRLAGSFPANGTRALFSSLLFFHFTFYLGLAVLTISVLSALADVADEHELATGRRQEGSFFAARTFFSQIASGFGHLLGGIALDVVGFPQGAKPGQVPDDVLFGLGMVDGPFACVPALAAIYFYSKYTINKQRHVQTQLELAARRKPAPAVQPDAAIAATSAVEGAQGPA